VSARLLVERSSSRGRISTKSSAVCATLSRTWSRCGGWWPPAKHRKVWCYARWDDRHYAAGTSRGPVAHRSRADDGPQL